MSFKELLAKPFPYVSEKERAEMIKDIMKPTLGEILMKKKKFRFRDSIQRHHIIYPSASMSKKGRVTIVQPEEATYIFGKEHTYIAWLNRFRYVSSGLIKCLKVFIALREGKAVKLTRKDWLRERDTKQNTFSKKDLEKLKKRY